MYQGLQHFESLQEAVQHGFHFYDRLPDGTYLVRTKTAAGYALAYAGGPR